MKARLYRGPFNGKVYHVPDHENYFMIAKPDKIDLSREVDPMALTYKQYVYRRTRHTHPDGSVFFEWDKPRG